MSTTTKITKKDRFNEIMEILAEVSGAEDLIAFCQNEINLLDKKSAKAKETAQAKKNETDELYDVVLSLMTDEVQTRDAIAAQIEGDDVSVAKVGARITKMVNAGLVEKEEVVIPAGEGTKRRVVQGYKLAPQTEEG